MLTLLLDSAHETFLEERARTLHPTTTEIQTGVVTGQIHDTRIHVVSLIPAPDLDTNKVSASLVSSVVARCDEISSSCPGGIQVLGVYMVASADQIKQYQEKIVKEVLLQLQVKTGCSSDHFLVKYTLQRKLTCDVVADRYKARPEDETRGRAISVKVQSKLMSTANWRRLEATYHIDQVLTFNPGTPYLSQLDTALAPYQRSVEQAMYTIDDIRHSPSSVIECLGGLGGQTTGNKKSKGKSAPLSAAAGGSTNHCSSHRVKLFRPPTTYDTSSISPVPLVVRVVGTFHVMALVHIKRAIEEGIKWIVLDLMWTTRDSISQHLHTFPAPHTHHIVTLPPRTFTTIGITPQDNTPWIPIALHSHLEQKSSVPSWCASWHSDGMSPPIRVARPQHALQHVHPPTTAPISHTCKDDENQHQEIDETDSIVVEEAGIENPVSEQRAVGDTSTAASTSTSTSAMPPPSLSSSSPLPDLYLYIGLAIVLLGVTLAFLHLAVTS